MEMCTKRNLFMCHQSSPPKQKKTISNLELCKFCGGTQVDPSFIVFSYDIKQLCQPVHPQHITEAFRMALGAPY